MISENTWRQMGVFVALALVAGTVSNATAGKTRKLRWLAEYRDLSTPPPAPSPTPGAVDPVAAAPPATPEAASAFEVHTERVLEEYQGGALFLDARASHDFADGHIKGARSFAVWEADVDDKVVGLPGEYPLETRIVVYCNGGSCTDSHHLREKLLGVGYSHVLVYKDGYPAWSEAGHPVEKGQ